MFLLLCLHVCFRILYRLLCVLGMQSEFEFFFGHVAELVADSTRSNHGSALMLSGESRENSENIRGWLCFPNMFCPLRTYVAVDVSCVYLKHYVTLITSQARHKFNLASKYMAMLSLSAMDPSKRNRQQAEHDLQSFICRRRKHVRSASTAAACTSGSGGVNVPDQPDFILPYSIFILAHHPDFPEVGLRLCSCCIALGDRGGGALASGINRVWK
jgi:hypothetical protein